jgi:hypothetical protein
MGRRRICSAIVVLAAVAVTTAATGMAAEKTAKRPLPAKLVGKWTRNITVADWEKAGAPEDESFVGLTTMVVKANGSVSIIDFLAKFSSVSAGRLTISDVPACSGAGLYQWKRVGGHLTLTKLRDGCPAEVGLFTGVWTKS